MSKRPAQNDGGSQGKRRALMFSLAAIAVGMGVSLAMWFAPREATEVLPPAWLRGLLDLVWIAVFLALALGALAKNIRWETLSLASAGAVAIAAIVDIARRSLGLDFGGFGSSLSFLIVFTTACAMLGWRLGLAGAAFGLWFMSSTVEQAVFDNETAFGSGGAVLVTMLVGAPGLIIAGLREAQIIERARSLAFHDQFSEVRRDLTEARQIHEDAFPPEHREGVLQYTYVYEPMREIGGDYIHAYRPPREGGREAPICIALLDVTGHGIAAALTVNRLHGELTRLYGENPEMRPIDICKALNKYVYLTLADHSVFVTGFMMRADVEEGVLEYASAGHPPAFHRSSTGLITELPSTAMVLGAMEDEFFTVDEASRRFGPGDSVIAYTDGATEARPPDGEMLGVEGLKKVFETGWADPEQRWPGALLREVKRFRKIEADDDTLIVELFRTLGGGTST